MIVLQLINKRLRDTSNIFYNTKKIHNNFQHIFATPQVLCLILSLGSCVFFTGSISCLKHEVNGIDDAKNKPQDDIECVYVCKHVDGLMSQSL